MGIRFNCPNGHKLNVKSFLAGKRGICPHCGAKFVIPVDLSEENDDPIAAGASDAGDPGSPGSDSPQQAADPVSPDSTSPGIAATAAPQQDGANVEMDDVHSDAAFVDAIAEAPQAIWYVRLPSGDQFGPAESPTMNRWLAEGRVSTEAMVWRDDWPQWQKAAIVFPQLQGAIQPMDGSRPVPPATPPAPAASVPSPSTGPMAATVEYPESPAAGAKTEGATPKIVEADQLQRRPHRRGRKRSVAILWTLIVVVVILGIIVVWVLWNQN